MKLLLIGVATVFLTACASTHMTEAGAHVRVVNTVNADFTNECRFIRAIDMNAAVWTPASANAGIRAELRNKAAEVGGNVIVYTAGSADAFTAHGAADVYYCEIPKEIIMKRNITILCLSLIWSGAVFGAATYSGTKLLPSFDYQNAKIELVLYDSVKDGCLPKPTDLKNAYEVELRRLGFGITEAPDYDYANGLPTLLLEYTGFMDHIGDTEIGCSVSYSLRMEVAYSVVIGDTSENLPITVWRSSGVSSSKNGQSMQSFLQDRAKGLVNDLYLSIMRAQEDK